MKRFLLLAFVASFFFSYFLLGPGTPFVIAGALGGAAFYTLVGWLVARKSAPRWGAAAIGVVAVLAFIGHF